MTFVFPVLLGGLVLAGIPVLLHLLLRQKPKTLLFPAFQFLVQRHRTNLTKLRLRHILLMALRMLLLAAIVLALAQPKILDNPWSLPSDQAVAAVAAVATGRHTPVAPWYRFRRRRPGASHPRWPAPAGL